MNRTKFPCKTTFIYGLVDPDTFEVRYVGKSNDPNSRFYAHLEDFEGNPWKYRWISKLRRANKKPKLVILEEVLESTWQKAERKWIAHFRSISDRLTNIAPGGEGVALSGPDNPMYGIKGEKHPLFGKKRPKEVGEKISKIRIERGTRLSEESIRKMAATLTGRPLTEEHKRKISEGGKGKKKNDEHRRKLSEYHRGRKLSEETKEKIAQAAKGRKHSDETKKLMSEVRTGKRHSEEARRKMSEACMGRKQSEESINKMKVTLTGRSLSKEHKENIAKGMKLLREKQRRERLSQNDT